MITKSQPKVQTPYSDSSNSASRKLTNLAKCHTISSY